MSTAAATPMPQNSTAGAAGCAIVSGVFVFQSLVNDLHLLRVELSLLGCEESPITSLPLDDATIIACQTKEASIMTVNKARNIGVHVLRTMVEAQCFATLRAAFGRICSTNNTNLLVVSWKSLCGLLMLDECVQKATQPF